jgi:hypothetical protein
MKTDTGKPKSHRAAPMIMMALMAFSFSMVWGSNKNENDAGRKACAYVSEKAIIMHKSDTLVSVADSTVYYKRKYVEYRDLFFIMSSVYESLSRLADSLDYELAECAWAYSSLMEEYMEVLKTADPREYHRIMNWNDSMKELEKTRTLR